jgi:hypothetical protein
VSSPKVKIEGMKDDLDVVAIVKAFEVFRDDIQLISDSAEKMIVELDFESSHGKNHYNFKQEEQIILSGIKISPDTKKIVFGAVFGANDKYFNTDEAELIKVTRNNLNGDPEGELVTRDLSEWIREGFSAAFHDLKINSIPALQAMVRNNPPLLDIINNPGKFLEEIDRKGSRGKAYSKLEKYGRY